MAVTAQGAGTQTATTNTEHTLLDVAVSGTFVFVLDAAAMLSGDTLELRIYQIVVTGGTRHVAYMATFYNAQLTDDLIKVSVPVSNELTDAGALRFTLKQTTGTGRAYPWKVLTFQ